MKDLILKADKGLKTKFDSSIVKFKKTFKQAERLGVDLNNTMEYFKKDGVIWKVSFVSGHYSKKLGGKYFEDVQVYPMIVLRKK